jgi:hypothetical protein
MDRRAVLAGAGACTTGVLAGCLGSLLGDTTSDAPRLVGLEAGNWHPDPQTLTVLIESDDDVLYETRVQLPGGDPSDYERRPEVLEGYPSEVPPSATLVTWVEDASRDDGRTLDFGARDTECIGVEIDICPECSEQKGQEEITVPEIPDTLIKYTANCGYSG